MTTVKKIGLVSFVLSFSLTNTFLLDGTTPSTNSELSDKHFFTLMDLLITERKARKQLEVYVTQLHRELVAKTSNQTSGPISGHGCTDCNFKIQNLEKGYANLQQRLANLEQENGVIKTNNSELLKDFSMMQMENTNIKIENRKFSNQLQTALSEIDSLKQLKSIDQIQTLKTVEMDTQALKQQVSALQNTQLARSQDFLALYNQTVVNKAETLAMKDEIIKQHNKSVTDLSNNFSSLAIQQNQSVNQILEKIKMSEMNLNNSVVAVTSTITQLRIQVDHDSQARGTTYVRWSRTQCPNDADLVYAGYTGGGYYNEQGSAAEPVCLPKDPEFNKTSGSGGGRMYGAEFNSNLFASNSVSQDVPCAVCRTHSTTSIIMIPGKTSCHSGWRREYYGYLASGDVGHQSASAYVCVDISPEFVPGGLPWNGNSKLFYEVVAKCGSLKCPPYHQNYPLTCVVCSR